MDQDDSNSNSKWSTMAEKGSIDGEEPQFCNPCIPEGVPAAAVVTNIIPEEEHVIVPLSQETSFEFSDCNNNEFSITIKLLLT